MTGAMIGRVPVHPLAELFPAIEGEAFAALVADIKANGLREKIVIWRGAVLDGRNRLRALREAGMINVMRPADELIAAHPGFFRRIDLPEAKLPGFVISANLNRRHLTESQRAMVAARLATLAPGRRKAANLPGSGDASAPAAAPSPVPPDAPAAEAEPAGVATDDAAALLGVSPRSVRDGRAVLAVPALAAEVTAGAVSVSGAAGAVRAAVKDLGGAGADPEAVYRAVKARMDRERQEKIAAKKRARADRAAALAGAIRSANAALGAAISEGKRYGVILADPEWRFETWSEAGKDRAPENHYPCSSLDEIKARPVADLAARDCVLLLWATAPMLPAALAVLAAWGFAYKTHLIWDKQRAGTGYWLRNRHELLLIGTRGAPPCPALGTQWESVLAEPATRHSEKPDVAHRFAEEFFPGVPKIELNARAARDGWDVWGAESPERGVRPDGDPEAVA